MARRLTTYAPTYTNPLSALAAGASSGWQGAEAQQKAVRAAAAKMALDAALKQQDFTLRQSALEDEQGRAAASLTEQQRYHDATLKQQQAELAWQKDKAAQPPPVKPLDPTDLLDMRDKALSTVSLLPPGQQPGYLTATNPLLQKAGVDPLAVPGTQIGTRRPNFGLPPAQLAALNGDIADPQKNLPPGIAGPPAAFASPALGMKPLADYQAAPDVPVLAPAYGPNAKDQSNIQRRAALTRMGQQNFGLRREMFQSEDQYRQATVKARQRALDLTEKFGDAGMAHQQVMGEVAQFNAQTGRMNYGTGQQRLGLDQSKFGFDQQKFGTTQSQGAVKSYDSLINKEESLAAQYDKEKRDVILSAMGTDGKVRQLSPGEQDIVDRANTNILKAQHNIRAYQKGLNPVTGKPLPGAATTASTFLGTYGGPNGCATTVCKIAKATGVPVPQTASAAAFERQLPAKGWQRVSGPPGPNDIVTMPGRGPSGRHVGWSVGNGQMVNDPGKSSGYSVTRSPIPSGAVVWRHPLAQAAPGVLHHSATQPRHTATGRFVKPQAVRSRSGKTYSFTISPS